MIEKSESEITRSWGCAAGELSPAVSVQLIAYNQEEYVARALDGMLEQVTDFPFEIIAHDDASTDGTAEIIRGYEKRYPRIVKPIYETVN